MKKEDITLSKLAICVIKIYKYLISPFLPSSCRFYPTCSEYAILAFQRYGFLKGTYLSARRLARCHPFNPGGIDYIS